MFCFIVNISIKCCYSFDFFFWHRCLHFKDTKKINMLKKEIALILSILVQFIRLTPQVFGGGDIFKGYMIKYVLSANLLILICMISEG